MGKVGKAGKVGIMGKVGKVGKVGIMGKVGKVGKLGKLGTAAKMAPTIPRRPPIRLASRAVAGAFMFRVSGRIDQNGRRWIELISGEIRCLVPLDQFSVAPQDVLRQINSVGILIVSEQAKTYLKSHIQAISQWNDIYIADHRGWHSDNSCFVLSSDCVIGREPDRRKIEVVLGDGADKWTRRRRQPEWLVTAKLLVGQSRPIFLASLAFVPPLLSIVPGFLNIGIELVGSPGIGKSTIAQWAGSIWGSDPTRATRFFEPWATTVNGLEPTIGSHSDALLGLDELNLFGSLNDRAVQRSLDQTLPVLASK